MRRPIIALIACGLVMGFWVHRAQSAAPDRAAAASQTNQPLVGAWRLVSIDYAGPNGALADPVFGPNPQGVIIYDQSGWMSVQIFTANRPVMTRPQTRTSGVVTADEAKVAAAAFNTYYAYFGTWEFNPDTSVVTHHLKSSLLPYEAGLDYRPEVAFDGAHLKLIARSQERGEERRRTLLWTRISDAGLIAAPPAPPPATAQGNSPTANSAAPLAQIEPPAPAIEPPPAAVLEPGPPTPARVVPTKYGDTPVYYEATIRKYFLEHLKYPQSVQYREITKPEQGFTTAISGSILMSEKRTYGWTVKATINAKNSHDGYVGFKTYTFLFRGEKIVDARLPLPGDEMN
ncbi:MAG: lipocalin-like domain-containing protein [Steroidobacteraceae bacterium]